MLQSKSVQRIQKAAREEQFQFRTQQKCMHQNSSPERLTGLYLRGKIFWFNHGSGKNRIQVSLETSDEAEAIKKATAILENLELNPCNGFLKEMNRYSDEKVSDGTWTSNSRISKISVLKMFGEDLGFKDLPGIATSEIQSWYDVQKKRVPDSAHGYMIIVRAFSTWAVGKKMLRTSPAAGVNMGKANSQARVKFCTFAQRDKCFKKFHSRPAPYAGLASSGILFFVGIYLSGPTFTRRTKEACSQAPLGGLGGTKTNLICHTKPKLNEQSDHNPPPRSSRR